MSTQTKLKPQYRVYKPKPSKQGAALQIESKPKGKNGTDCIFLTAVQQKGEDEKGNASFYWPGDKNEDSGKFSVIMKLGVVDIGELLCLLSFKKMDISLFHQTEHSNSILKASRNVPEDKAKPQSYYFNISSKRGDDLVKINIPLTLGEGEVLRVLLNRFIEEYYA